VAAYVPPGWPTGVHPPGSEEFAQTAVTWLLDVVPPDYRLHGVLRRHPVALAALARHHLAACVAGAREGYRTARAELGDRLPPGSMDAVLDAYRTEGRRLVETAHAVDLVTRALRGEVFTPQLAGTQDEGRSGAATRGSTGRGARPRASNPIEVTPKRAATSSKTTPAKPAASSETTPASAPAKATTSSEATPAKRAASSGKAKRAARDREAAPTKRAARSSEATSAKQR
jgi:hypothetical protein